MSARAGDNVGQIAIMEGQFERIASFILESGQEYPESALRFASTLLIDTLGVCAGAARFESGVIARDHAHAFQGYRDQRHAATMAFDGRKASIPGAAFAMATQIDNLDAHDGYNPTKGHIGCAVVPALMAFGESMPDLSGRQALQAMVMAYEVSARAAISLHASVPDYHTSGAWNALGVAALGCRLRGVGASVLREALGIAEYHGPRSQMMREIANPTMLHDGSGPGAMTGATAVFMAEHGFTGAPAITVEGANIAPIWKDLGTSWTVELNYIKPYPICRWAHAAIDAVRTLQLQHGFNADTVTNVKINTFTEASRLWSAPPETTSQAQYSLPFAVAVMLCRREIGPSQISGEGLRDERVLSMMSKIKVVEDKRHSDRFPQGRWSDVEIELASGKRLLSGDVHARGGPEAPMEESEIVAKLHTMTAGNLSSKRTNRLWAMRDRLLEPDSRLAELAEIINQPCDG